jgi:DnaK suppressor protein
VAKTVKKTSKTATAKKKTVKKKSAKKTVKKAAAKKTAKKTVKKATLKKTSKKAKAKKPVVKKTSRKKSSVKKTVKKKRVVKKSAPPRSSLRKSRKRKSSLTAKELDYFKNILLVKCREIIGDVNLIEKEALNKSRLEAGGDLSSMPIHMADMGTDNFEQEFSLGLMDSEKKLLQELNLALNRIAEGRYGLCEGTGKEISKPRLEAVPWAKYCIEYATMVEKGQVIEGEKVYDEDEEDFDGEDESPLVYDLLDYEDMEDKEEEDY